MVIEASGKAEKVAEILNGDGSSRLGGRGRLPASGSRRPVRARISAYGSSNHGLARIRAVI